jgi:hypothetical protein
VDRFHHKPLKKFSLDGSIHDESATPRLKNEYIRLLISEMKLTGYVPRIDIEPDFTIDYNSKKRCFDFEVSVYGIYVGRKKSECILGIDVFRPLYIQKNKSKGFLQEQAQI